MTTLETPTLETPPPWTVVRVARSLELHPFEVVRILSGAGGLPADFKLGRAEVARVIQAGGIEVWWSGGPPWASVGALAGPALRGAEEPAALRRALAQALLTRGVLDPVWTRADNLFRGLDPASQGTIRRTVNAWIRSALMGSRMAARGLEVTVHRDVVGEFRALAERGAGACARSLEDG